MKKPFKKFKISIYTYLFILICFMCGYIKNILIIFFICLFHELGHILFIKLFKYKIIKIELLPFGGFTTIDKKINSNINIDLLISFGGVIFQLILVILLIVFKNYLNIITYNLFFKYNLIILIFNLIPIIPLDGNNIIHLLLEKYFSYTISYYLNACISFLFLIIFFYFNYKYNIDNYFIISFLLYKIIEALKNFKYLKNRFLMERYLYNLDFQKIDNNTTNINNLRKGVFHYFKRNNKYVNEREVIKEAIFQRKIDKNRDF